MIDMKVRRRKVKFMDVIDVAVEVAYKQGQIKAFEDIKKRKEQYVVDDKWIDYKLKKLGGQGNLSGKKE